MPGRDNGEPGVLLVRGVVDSRYRGGVTKAVVGVDVGVTLG